MKRGSPKAVFRKLAALYKRMSDTYDQATQVIGLTCEGCTDNCCHSYFQHHTYVEWAYFWKGLEGLPKSRFEEFKGRAEEYVNRAVRDLEQGKRPSMMCPVNVDGLCGVYEHRFMICRLHGVPNVLMAPGRPPKAFAGCFRAQEITSGMDNPQRLDRTPLLTDLARLEMEFLGAKIKRLPKVDMTLAEMIVVGPPQF